MDGRNLTWNDEIDRLFKNNRYNSSATRIGCALSHYTLYRHIAATNNELHLVLEDDSQFIDDWIDVWNDDMFPRLPKHACARYSAAP